jgi:hypothetical protein
MRRDFSQTLPEQIISAVDVRDDVGQIHRAAAVPVRIPGVNDIRPFITGADGYGG